MQEPLRSRYLAALGIDAYVPRAVLPGARLSVACEWQAPAEEVAAELPAALDAAPADPAAAPAPTRLTAALQTPNKSPPAPVPARAARAAGQAGPAFALSVVVAANGVLLIDDAPATGAVRNEYQRLLAGFLKAVNRDEYFALDVFSWPLRNSPPGARDEHAARETLAAHLQKQIQQHSVKTLLLLGGAAQQWVNLDEAALRCVRSNSLLACLRDSSLKRQLWNDVRNLSAG